MQVKQKGHLTKMSRGRSGSSSGNWKERYFELSLSLAANSYALKYFKGPGKPKALGEIRIDQTSSLKTSTRIHSGYQCLVLTNETSELHFHAKTQKEQGNWEKALKLAISDTSKSANQRKSLDKHLKQKDKMMGSMDQLREAHRRQQQYIHVLEQENNDLNEMLQHKEREAAGVNGIVASGGLKAKLAKQITENTKLKAEVQRLENLVKRLKAGAAKSGAKSGTKSGASKVVALKAVAPKAASPVQTHSSSMIAEYKVNVQKSFSDDSEDSTETDDDDGAPPPPPSP